MKANNRLVSKLLASAVIAASGMGFAAITAAQVGVGAGAGISAGAAASAGTRAGDVSVATEGQGQAQGSAGTTGLDRSEERMSVKGSANQNAQGRVGATRGLDRARERMNEHGLDHAQSLDGESNANASASARGKSR